MVTLSSPSFLLRISLPLSVTVILSDNLAAAKGQAGAALAARPLALADQKASVASATDLAGTMRVWQRQEEGKEVTED